MIGGAFELRGKRKDGVMKGMAAVLWLMREKLLPSLFPSLMKLLVRTGSFEGHKEGQDGLPDSDRPSHTSQNAAWEFTESLAWASRQTSRSEVADAPATAATQDEAQDSSQKSQQTTSFRHPMQTAKGWIKVNAFGLAPPTPALLKPPGNHPSCVCPVFNSRALEMCEVCGMACGSG